ncbi:type IV pilin protein [Lactonifactor longoviformis]|uniref:type IV pilin protein n=1 Tax=Lactonifactor longoviformis TaxID=341220 RepID=UPI0036F3CF40
MNVMKKLRDSRKNKKGFTLVELIVVLVILAILMAILIPALTGYIRKAQDKQVLAEGRNVLMAAQTALSEQYEAKTDTGTIADVAEKVKAEISDLTDSELTGNYEVIANPDTYKVESLKYDNGKKVAVYSSTGDNKGWTVEKSSEAGVSNGQVVKASTANPPAGE